MTSSIDRLIDKSKMPCTVCGELFGGAKCNCWYDCTRCGWSVRQGTSCRNTSCRLSDSIHKLAESTAIEVVDELTKSSALNTGALKNYFSSVVYQKVSELLKVIYAENIVVDTKMLRRMAVAKLKRRLKKRK